MLKFNSNACARPFKDARRYVPYFQRRMCKDIRASLRKMLEDVGFEILHCSKREKSYQYSKQSLKSKKNWITRQNNRQKTFENQLNRKRKINRRYQDSLISLCMK